MQLVDHWTYCMMWQKIASETSEEEDDRMKEVVNDWRGLGSAMKDELGHVAVSEADIHREGRHRAWRIETRERCKGEV